LEPNSQEEVAREGDQVPPPVVTGRAQLVPTAKPVPPADSAAQDRHLAPTPAAVPSRRHPRPQREASLEVKRIDPWSVLKVSLIVGIVMLFIWLLFVAVLYLSFNSAGVWAQVNATYRTLATTSTGPLITFTGVLLVAAAIGVVNIVLFTTFSTIAAGLYNAATGMTGGVQITLTQRQ